MKWTPEMLDFMRETIPGHTESEIRNAFLDRFGIELSRTKIGNIKVRLGLRQNTHGGRFEKGHAPHNKGKKQADYLDDAAIERTKATLFCKGNLPANTLPVGVERISKEGYIEVHIAQRKRNKPNDQWVPKHRLMWEQEHGPIPDGHVVIFVDGNKRNFALDNLACISRGEMLRLNSEELEYHDQQTLQAALDIVRLYAKANDKARSERACRSCGHVFKPRYAHQRTCDVCLGRKRKL